MLKARKKTRQTVCRVRNIIHTHNTQIIIKANISAATEKKAHVLLSIHSSVWREHIHKKHPAPKKEKWNDTQMH